MVQHIVGFLCMLIPRGVGSEMATLLYVYFHS